MSHRRLQWWVVLLLLPALGALPAGCGSARGERKSSATGDRLPGVTLPPLRAVDRPVALARLRGPAVINVWASWCTPCRRELPAYQAFHARHPGIRVLGIDWEDPNAAGAKALIRRSGVRYPLVVDARPVVRSQGLPRLILLDREGRIAYTAYVQITSVGQLESLVRRHLGVRL